MQFALGILLRVFFLAGVIAVMRGQSPIIVLMLLAIAWAVATGAPLKEVLGKVIDGGATAYASAVIIIVFGAWFGQIVVQTGIAESMIRSAVELAGDQPLVVAWVVSLVTAFLFTSLYGVGAAIGVGVIALPIMRSMGIPPRVAAPAFTMAIGAGNYLNLVEFGIFQKFFPGIKYEGVQLRFFVIGFAVYLGMALAMSAYHLARGGARRFAAIAASAEPAAAWTRDVFTAAQHGRPVPEIYVAHELFHHLEATALRPASDLARVTRARLGPWTWRSGVRALSEIAARAFAQGLLDLPCFPGALDRLARGVLRSARWGAQSGVNRRACRR